MKCKIGEKYVTVCSILGPSSSLSFFSSFSCRNIQSSKPCPWNGLSINANQLSMNKLLIFPNYLFLQVVVFMNINFPWVMYARYNGTLVWLKMGNIWSTVIIFVIQEFYFSIFYYLQYLSVCILINNFMTNYAAQLKKKCTAFLYSQNKMIFVLSWSA